ncbi:YcnI family protein [Belnapia rosea]|uniref:Uncharacterized protein YcnI n=1 Tax=Belnapia rosea TaxID=938405 RepID=A0A1G6NN41_9PROT|nr:YcnI family protein [Belnapia rosea]SDC69380.1 Uncharacterized protein YcnI [Belnapia rosea]
MRPTALAAALMAAVAPAAFAPAAFAHVTLDPPQAAAGAYLRATLRVPHGCAGAATERIALRLPETILAARPMPKPGWRLTITRRALEVPVPNGHGGTITEAVSEITWEGGPLPDEQYDEFTVMLRTPEAPGTTLHLPVIQGCGGGATAAWVAIPAAGQHPAAGTLPAPTLRLLPAPPHAGHH